MFPDRPEALVATGYNRMWPDESNASDILLARQEALNDLTANVGSVFLGLTLGCAQCHDHNPYGFTMWMAGGGVKGGQVIGATDDFGLRAIEDEAHVHDIHATILAAMGLDHERLIFHHQGRPERPTVNEGFVIDGVLA